MKVNNNGYWQKPRWTPTYTREMNEGEWAIVERILQRGGHLADFTPGDKYYTSPCDPLEMGCREYTIMSKDRTRFLKVPFKMFLDEKIRMIREAKAAELAAATGVPAQYLEGGESCTATSVRITAKE